VRQAGGEPVRIPLDQTPAQVMKIIERCDGVLLPGSNADVDPSKFGAVRSPHTAPADARRDTVDELLLQDAYNMRKPILGICYGLQSLNVYRTGSLVQHIPDFLPKELRTRIDHEAGKKVLVAHRVEVEPNSKLAEIVGEDVSGSYRHPPDLVATPVHHSLAAAQRLMTTDHDASRGSAAPTEAAPEARKKTLLIPVNSSHHQSADVVGDGLRIVARSAEDGIIEAVEGTTQDHFVLAVQWHPERSVDEDEPSRAIFRALIDAAAERYEELKGELESVK
jgi:putative glutamine amidotransferase